MSEFENLSPEDERYVLNLPYHLAEAKMADDFYGLLTDFEFIEYKIAVIEAQPIIEDYNLAFRAEIQLFEEQKSSLYDIQRAIQQSANVLQQDKTQLAGQLLSRLFNLKNTDLEPFLEQIKNWNGYPWLRPIKIKLLTPRDPLVRNIPTQHPGIAAVAISADGKFALSAGFKDGLLKLWDLTTGKLVRNLEMKQTWQLTRELLTPFENEETVAAITDEEMRDKTWASALAISPDGNWGLSGSYTENLYSPKFQRLAEPRSCIVELWNLAEGQSVLTFGVGHKDAIHSVSLSLNGDYALVGTGMGELFVCDLKKRRNDRNNIQRWSDYVVNIHTGMKEFIDGNWVSVGAVAISFDGRWALAANNEILKVWDLLEGCLHQIIPLKLEKKVKAITLNSEGQIFLLSEDGRLSLLQSEAFPSMTPTDVHRSIWKLDEYYSRRYNSDSWYNSGNRSNFILRISKIGKTIRESLIARWDTYRKTKVATLAEIPFKLPYNIVSDTVTPDTRWTISCTKDGGIQLWDLSIAQEIIKSQLP